MWLANARIITVRKRMQTILIYVLVRTNVRFDFVQSAVHVHTSNQRVTFLLAILPQFAILQV